MATYMAEQGMLLNVLSAKQGTRSIRASSSSAGNSLTKESIPIKSVLLEFSSVIQENLKRDNPTLTIRFRENGDNVECILGGTTQEVGNAKSNLLSMERDLKEKKLLFATNTCSDLKRFSIDIEHIVSNLLKNDNQHCVAKQVNNEVFLYGFDRNWIDKAAKYVSGNISHRDFLLWGSQREWKEAVVDHFKKGYQDKIVVYIDETCRLNVLGQKDAVDEACCEYVDISEGRKEISPTNMLPQGKTKVTQKFGPLKPVHFRFFNTSVQLEQVVQCEKVTIFADELNYSFSVQGEEENVSRAVGYLNKISLSIRTNEIKVPSSCPISIIRSSENNSDDLENYLLRFDVLLEKKITYVCGRLQVTNRLHDNYSSIWLSLSGKQLTVKLSAFDNLHVDNKFVMKERDPSKGGFKVIRDGLIEIAVPDKVSRGQTDDNIIGNIINTTLGKVASSRAKVVAFLISPFANWNFNSIMKCMVNSFVEWLLRPGIDEGFSVTLCVANHSDFVETDAYFGSRLWTRMKEFNQPKIKIEKGHLDKAVADVIVNTFSPDLDLLNGKVSLALLKAAGRGLQEECTKGFSDGINPDIIVVTGGYALNCKAVFHITLHTLQRERISECSISNIRNAMILCLKTASDYNYESIAFPAIGTGPLKYPIEEVASEMVMAIERFTKYYIKAVPIKEVLIVIHPKDSDLFETFQRMVKQLVTKTEVNIILEITEMERNVRQCKS